MSERERALLDGAINQIKEDIQAGEKAIETEKRLLGEKRLQEEREILDEFESVVRPVFLENETYLEKQIPQTFTKLIEEAAKKIEQEEQEKGIKLRRYAQFFFKDEEIAKKYFVYQKGESVDTAFGELPNALYFKKRLIENIKRKGEIPVLCMQIGYCADVSDMDIYRTSEDARSGLYHRSGKVEAINFSVYFNKRGWVVSHTSFELSHLASEEYLNPFNKEKSETFAQALAEILINKNYYRYISTSSSSPTVGGEGWGMTN